MLQKNDDGFFFDSNPKLKNGSIYTFEQDKFKNHAMYKLSSKEYEYLNILLKTTQDLSRYWLYSCEIYIILQEVTPLSKNSIRGLLQRLKKKFVFQKEEYFKSNYPQIHCYNLTSPSEVIALHEDNHKDITSHITQTALKYPTGNKQPLLKLNEAVDTQYGEFYAVSDNLIAKALFGVNYSIPFTLFMGDANSNNHQNSRKDNTTITSILTCPINDILPLKNPNTAITERHELKKSNNQLVEHFNDDETNMFSSADDNKKQYSKTTQIKVVASAQSSHKSGVMTCDDIPLFNIALHLTIAYHSARSNDYHRSEKIDNITPIASHDFFQMNPRLKKAIDKYDQLNDFMYKVAVNTFSLKSSSIYSDLQMEGDQGKMLWSIKDVQYYPRRKNSTKQRVKAYFIEWNFSILKELFNQQYYFLFPLEVFHYSGLIQTLYQETRKQIKYQSTREFNLDKLINILQYKETTSKEAANLIAKHIISDFNIPSDVILRNGKTTRAKLISFRHTAIIGGIEFKFMGSNLNTKNPILTINTTADKQAVYIASQPIKQQARLQNIDDLEVFLSNKNNGMPRSPIAFNNLSVVSEKLQKFVDIQLNDDQMQSIQDNALTIRIRPTQYSFIVHIENVEGRYAFHRYITGHSFVRKVEEIATLAKASLMSVRTRTEDAMNNIQFIPLKDNEELSRELFSQIATDIGIVDKEYDDLVTLAIQFLVRRHIIMKSIPIDDDCKVKEMVINAFNFAKNREFENSMPIGESNMIEDAVIST